jgi:hypothetical protein
MNNKKPLNPHALRDLLFLLLNTALLFGIYKTLLFYAENTDETFYSFCVMALYTALLLGFLLAYLIYNRFLYRKGLTEEDLPDSMTPEQKQAFLEDGRTRLKKSKWMMLIILPLVLTFLFDAVDLFLLDLFR